MLRTIATVLIVLAIAIGGGAASVWYALGATGGLGALEAGVWTAYPFAGTPQADPYSRARVSRDADLPLGGAEGIVFVAARDSGGSLLRRDCMYRVEGNVPPARIWTLYPADPAHVPLPSLGQRPPALSSLGVLRAPDNALIVTASQRVAPGNWLPVSGSGPMTLVLTLYDTAVASNEAIAAVDMPQVLRVSCDD